jgi:hypothetical protein
MRLQHLCIVCLLCLVACRQQAIDIPLSFYYWKTHFFLTNSEQIALQRNNVAKLFVRYFDIEMDDMQAKPVSPIVFDQAIPSNIALVPVIYIKNKVFEQSDSAAIGTLCNRVFRLVGQINQSQGISNSEIQFDCDWTDKTQQRFFYFVAQYKKISQQTISATIRLHQVKYSQRTGIPPIDYGILMFYNMGNINAKNSNSIYEKTIATKYIAALKDYPLPLALALPIFSWAMQCRDEQVVQLLNKTYTSDFSPNAHFKPLSPNRFLVEQSQFKGGYYLKQGDEIKIENITAQQLGEMATILQKNLPKPPLQVLFYDLDSLNLAQYDSLIFQQTLQQFY